MENIGGRISARQDWQQMVARLQFSSSLVPAGTFLSGMSLEGVFAGGISKVDGIPTRRFAAGDEAYFTMPIPVTPPQKLATFLTATLYNDQLGSNTVQVTFTGKLYFEGGVVDYTETANFVIAPDTIAQLHFTVNDLQQGYLSGELVLDSATSDLNLLGIYLGF